ncbi:hypothetical protein LCGC14_2728190 [marine sediment metagenome]|uniref:Uncharacterized protein n=1 Tax=marine sediment metagenome TaxID=412755 RepID=A0A0F8Z8A2_9ZZZZ
MSKKSKIQQEHETQRNNLVSNLAQTEQNIRILEGQLEQQQIRRYKLIGALEYHDQLFPPEENK